MLTKLDCLTKITKVPLRVTVLKKIYLDKVFHFSILESTPMLYCIIFFTSLEWALYSFYRIFILL